MQSQNSWYHRNGLQTTVARDAHGRCRRAKVRAAKVDPLLPRCDHDPIPGQLKWLRPMLGGRQGRSKCYLVADIQPIGVEADASPTESNAGCDDNMGFHLPLAVVP